MWYSKLKNLFPEGVWGVERVRKYIVLYIVSILVVGLVIFSPGATVAAEKEDLNTLLEKRQVDCWVEGELFGDLVLGSRGTIRFVYLDGKLSKAIMDNEGLASWVDDLNQHYGSPSTKKKALFIATLEANKPWRVEEEKISVGGYSLVKKDVVSSSWQNPFGMVDSGTTWNFAFVVPAEIVKPGKEIEIGYDEYLVKWKVPK